MFNQVSSYECNCVYRSLKIQDFNGVRTRDLVIPMRQSLHLSYEATDLGNFK